MWVKNPWHVSKTEIVVEHVLYTDLLPNVFFKKDA